MSAEIIIKPKGLFKKMPPLDELLFDHMYCGIYDEHYRLEANRQGEHTIVFDERYINRGFDVIWSKKELTMYLNYPTGKQEVELFFDYIDQLCRYLDVDHFYYEGQKYLLSDISECLGISLEGAQAGLDQLNDMMESGDMECLYIFGAFHPIAVGLDECEEFGRDLELFGNYLKDKMMEDIYYAAPHIYNRQNKTTFGVYAVRENVRSVLPDHPGILMSEQKVDDWYVWLGLESGERYVIKYEDLLFHAPDQHYYDASHFFITLDAAAINELSQYVTDVG